MLGCTVLEAAGCLIKVLSDSNEVASHCTCPLSSRSLGSNLVICILRELNLRRNAPSRLNWVACLRDRWLKRLLLVAWVLLKIDTFEITNTLIVLAWSHLHLPDISKRQIAFFQVFLDLGLLVRKVEIEFFESHTTTTTLLLLLCGGPSSNYHLCLISQCKLVLVYNLLLLQLLLSVLHLLIV